MLTCMDLRTCDLRDWVWSGVCLAGCHVFTMFATTYIAYTSRKRRLDPAGNVTRRRAHNLAALLCKAAHNVYLIIVLTPH